MHTANRKRILILSDSLALPRSVDGVTLLRYEDTWPNLLRAAMPHLEFAQASVGSITLCELLAQVPYWRPFNPDMAIIQAGLNDCLDRALHRFELEFCKKFKRFGRHVQIVTGKHAPFFRKIRNIRYCSEVDYRQCLSALKGALPEVIMLGIVVDRMAPVTRFPHCRERIDRYNDLGRGIFGDHFIDLSGLGNGHTQNDQFHVQASGHRIIANQLQKMLTATPELATRPTSVTHARATA